MGEAALMAASQNRVLPCRLQNTAAVCLIIKAADGKNGNLMERRLAVLAVSQAFQGVQDTGHACLPLSPGSKLPPAQGPSSRRANLRPQLTGTTVSLRSQSIAALLSSPDGPSRPQGAFPVLPTTIQNYISPPTPTTNSSLSFMKRGATGETLSRKKSGYCTLLFTKWCSELNKDNWDISSSVPAEGPRQKGERLSLLSEKVIGTQETDRKCTGNTASWQKWKGLYVWFPWAICTAWACRNKDSEQGYRCMLKEVK